MFKKIVLSFVLCFLFSCTALAGSYEILEKITECELPSGISVSVKNYDFRDKITKISGIVPNISGNQHLKNQMEAIIATKLGKAVSGNFSGIVFDYKIVISEKQNTLSILLKSTLSTNSLEEEVSALVFDMETGEILNISSFLGINGTKIATGVANSYINKNFRNMPKVSEIDNKADFYITDNSLELIFDKYEIAPGSEGILSVSVFFENLQTLTISKEEYINSKEKNNVRLFPLRKTVASFGYFIHWDGATGEIVIHSGENFVSESKDNILIKANQNSYKKQEDLSPQVLEAAPEIENGYTYVPLSFFEGFMNIYYSTGADGAIELSAYKE